MNKFLSIAVLALLQSSSALRIADDDLWSDDAQAEETLASIQSAEKVHNTKLGLINAEDQKELIKTHTKLNFNKDDEFVNYAQKNYN